jgi:hypothetical protein
MTQPNVLFFITDQQRADHVGFAGNPVVSTPNLDGLADRSTVFDRAFVSNPVCMPNRSTIMTGRMRSAHRVIFNDRSLSPGANTFVRELRANGYRSALIGKSHLQHGMSPTPTSPSPVNPGSPNYGLPGGTRSNILSAMRARRWTIPTTSTDSDRSSSPSATATRSADIITGGPASIASVMANWLPGSPPPATCPSSHRTGSRSMRRGSPKSSTPPTSSPNEQSTSSRRVKQLASHGWPGVRAQTHTTRFRHRRSGSSDMIPTTSVSRQRSKVAVKAGPHRARSRSGTARRDGRATHRCLDRGRRSLPPRANGRLTTRSSCSEFQRDLCALKLIGRATHPVAVSFSATCAR